jgi:hypothetical protein
MGDSSPERTVRRSVVLDAASVGVALGVISLGGGSLVLIDSSGLLLASAGLTATLVVALLVGLWVSAPAVELEDPPVRERWLAAALALAAAGAYASFLEISDSLTAGAGGRVGALLLLITIPAYTLGMALPVLLAWAEHREEVVSGGPAAGSALGWLTGGLLGGVAVGVLACGLFLTQGVGPGPVLLGASVLLLAPMLLHASAARETREEILFETDTPFNTLRITEVVYPGDRQPERRLYLNGEEESGELVRSGAPTLAYIAAAEAWLAEGSPRGATYLFLGGGAYTLPRRVAERDARAAVTVVELDPEVTRAAYRFFGLRPEHGVRTVHGDARAFLARPDGEVEFDRIYVDVYGGQESLPYALVTREALELVKGRLRAGGIASLNVIGTTHGPESMRFWSLVRTFAAAFDSVALYTHLGADYPERQNLLLAGSADGSFSFGERAGFFTAWPRAEWPSVPGAVVYRDLFAPETGGRGNEAYTLALTNRRE